MPIVIMIGVHAIPASIVRLKRVMRPAITRICAGNHDILAGESQRPYLWRVGVIDSWFDCGRNVRWRFFHGARLRQVVVDKRIAFYSRHIGTRCQRIGDLPCSFHQDCVNNVEGSMLNAAVAQPLQNSFLRRLALVQQSVIHEACLLILGLQIGRAAQVGLISEHNEKFGLLPVCRVFHHPRRDLGRSRRRTGDRRSLLVADSARGSDGSYGSCRGCDEEQ